MNQVHSRKGLTHTAQMALRGALLEYQTGQFVRASVETGTAALASAAEGMSGDLLQIVRDSSEPWSYPIVLDSWLLLRGVCCDPPQVSAHSVEAIDGENDSSGRCKVFEMNRGGACDFEIKISATAALPERRKRR